MYFINPTMVFDRKDSFPYFLMDSTEFFVLQNIDGRLGQCYTENQFKNTTARGAKVAMTLKTFSLERFVF